MVVLFVRNLIIMNQKNVLHSDIDKLTNSIEAYSANHGYFFITRITVSMYILNNI